MKIDKFAKHRWCDDCFRNVEVEFKPKTIPHTTPDGKQVPITYTASYCSICGRILCERDFDDALMEYEKQQNAK